MKVITHVLQFKNTTYTGKKGFGIIIARQYWIKKKSNVKKETKHRKHTPHSVSIYSAYKPTNDILQNNYYLILN